MRLIRGELSAFYGTGMEGLAACVEETDSKSYDGSHYIEEGDYLIIYDDGPYRILWSGFIKIGHVNDRGMIWTQEAVSDNQWKIWFLNEYRATLIKLSTTPTPTHKSN